MHYILWQNHGERCIRKQQQISRTSRPLIDLPSNLRTGETLENANIRSAKDGYRGSPEHIVGYARAPGKACTVRNVYGPS